MLQAWNTYFWEVSPILVCSTSQTLSAKHTAVFRPLPARSDQVKKVIFMDFTVPLEEGCDEAQERKTLK